MKTLAKIIVKTSIWTYRLVAFPLVLCCCFVILPLDLLVSLVWNLKEFAYSDETEPMYVWIGFTCFCFFMLLGFPKQAECFVRGVKNE